jgi:hypothetical protein
VLAVASKLPTRAFDEGVQVLRACGTEDDMWVKEAVCFGSVVLRRDDEEPDPSSGPEEPLIVTSVVL